MENVQMQVELWEILLVEDPACGAGRGGRPGAAEIPSPSLAYAKSIVAGCYPAFRTGFQLAE